MKFFLRPALALALPVLAMMLSACGEKTPEQIAADNKKYTETSVRRAQVLLFEGKTKGAVEMLEAAYGKCGASPELCEAMAYSYSQDAQPASAAMFFEKASDLKGGDYELLISAAKSYEQAGALSSAAVAYDKYLKLKPQDMVAWKALANCLEKQGKFQEALNAYLGAVKVAGRNPNTAEAAAIGALFVKVGNVTQARRWLEAARQAAAHSDNAETKKNILLGLVAVYLADKSTAELEGVVAELDKLDRSAIDQNYPALRSQLADFRNKLEEAQSALKAEETKKAEEAKKQAEAAEAAKKAEEAKRAEEKKAEDAKIAETEKSETPEPAPVDSAAPAPFTPMVEESARPSEMASGPTDVPPSPVQKYIARAYDFLGKGDAKSAAKAANLAIFEDRDSAEAWRVLAKAYEAEHRDNDSYLAAREAYVRNTDDINATLFYLRNASRVQNNEQFLNSLYAAHKKFPNNVEILIGLARTYKLIGDLRNSKYFYKQFVDTAPKEHPLYREVYDEYEVLLGK